MKLFTKKPDSLGDLSEDELTVLLFYLERPGIISRIALDNFVGWHQIYKKNGIAGSPPSWLTQWAEKMEVAPLFSIDEGDHSEGVAYIITDFSTNEFWFGVAGGLCEIVDSHNLVKINCVGGRLTALDVFPVWANLLSYEHDDLMQDIFGADFKVYDKKLLPAKHLLKFKKEVATYPKRR